MTSKVVYEQQNFCGFRWREAAQEPFEGLRDYWLRASICSKKFAHHRMLINEI
jgi:hypothetical protein